MHGSFLDAAVEHLALADLDRLLGCLGQLYLMQRLDHSYAQVVSTLYGMG